MNSDFIFFLVLPMKKLKALLGNWLETLRAFPVAHGALLLLSLLTTLQIAYAGIFSDHSWEHWSYVLAFTLLLSLYGPLWELHFPQLKQGRFVSNLLQLIAVIGGVICYFYFLPQVKLGFSDQSFQLWGLFFVALIGIFFLLAYAYRTMETKTRFSYGMLIYALLFGGLAGVIIFGGIAGTFRSLELLFDLDIVSEVYGYLASWTLIFFTGSFVLNYYTFLIKTTFSKGDEFEYIPTRAEKVFGVWIFLPLTLLYLAIFLAYGLKIFFT